MLEDAIYLWEIFKDEIDIGTLRKFMRSLRLRSGEENMELKYDREENLKERIDFIHYYVQWIKRTPNEIWSKQQAELIDSFMQNTKNFKISPEKYLEMVERREVHI